MKIPPNSVSSFYSQALIAKSDANEDTSKSQQEVKVEQAPKPKVKKVQKYPEGAQHWAEQIRLHHPEKYAEWVARHKEKSQSGYPDVSILPHGFSIKDYYAEQFPEKKEP